MHDLNARYQDYRPGQVRLSSGHQFFKMLNIERLRSERTSIPFCYVIIDYSHNKFNPRSISHFEYFLFNEVIVDSVINESADVDAVYYCHSNTTRILFPDLNLEKAKVLIEKMMQRVYKDSRIASIVDNNPIIQSIYITSYPLSQIPEQGYLKAKPVIIRDLRWRRKKSNDGRVLQENDQVFIDWHVNRSNPASPARMPPILDETNEINKKLNYKITKRLIDILGAFLLLIVFSPTMIVVALLIKLTSKGPVFFKQDRVGHFGEHFKFLKFRSMRTDVDESIHKDYVTQYIKGEQAAVNHGTEDNPVFKLVDDPRVTKIGKFIRKFSLDEIPQLFNVLKGDMSLVGPRPPIPYEVEEYSDWHYRRITEVKPGISGLWQVSGRNSTTFDEMVRLDISYIDRWSVILDIQILFLTVGAVFNRSGS